MKKRYTSAELMAAIDSLAQATATGFASVHSEMNRRFANVEARFQNLEYSMNKRFDSVDLRFDAFERRVANLETKA